MAAVIYNDSPQSFGTVQQCERWIAEREAVDPAGVKRGDYTIDMTEAEEAAYQRSRIEENECTYCGALPGFPCLTAGGEARPPHANRK
jgi:hypothetical protein